MKRYVDLHIHSSYSDGSWTPAEIVDRAARYELAAISITDHDAVGGIAEGMAAAQKAGIDFVPGIEISTAWLHGRMHILGYFIDPDAPAVRSLLDRLQESRRGRIYRVCAKLKELGKPVDPALVFELAGDAASVGRPHIARAMVKLGFVPTVQDAFDLYLAYGKPAYVPRWAPEPKEAIEIIHRAGGVAVIAHCPVTEGCMERIDDIRSLGIDGVEVYYPQHKPHQVEWLKEYARKHNLVITGGSDCHGLTRGEPLLGIYKVPYEVYEGLLQYYEQRVKATR